jgi:hypothetical protein
VSNPFLDRIAQRPKNSHGKASERRLVKSMGAKAMPNSGAMVGAKSDATLQEFRLEMKSTTGVALPVERYWLEKISHEAAVNGQTPALIMSFVKPDGSPQLQSIASDWVAIPRWSFEELREKAAAK